MTKDLRTDQVKDVIEKVRVADLAIYSPKRLFDWRISINMEIPRMSRFLEFIILTTF